MRSFLLWDSRQTTNSKQETLSVKNNSPIGLYRIIWKQPKCNFICKHCFEIADHKFEHKTSINGKYKKFRKQPFKAIHREVSFEPQKVIMEPWCVAFPHKQTTEDTTWTVTNKLVCNNE